MGSAGQRGFPGGAKPVSSANIGRDYGLGVLEIVRDSAGAKPVDTGQEVLENNDVLLLSGSREAVERLVAQRENFVLLGQPPDPEEMAKGQAELVEVTVPPRSPFIGKSLRKMGFREKHGLTAVALWRDGHPVRTGARDELLQQGDGILLYGPRENTRSLEPGPGLLWLNAAQEPEAPRELRHLAPWAVLLLVAVVGVAAAGIVPIAVSALAGAGLAVLLGMVRMREAYRAIDWQTLVLIGGMYSLGLSMHQTGASSKMAGLLVGAAGGMGPLPLLMCLAAVTMLLTQFLHNAAVAMIMAPVAMSVAQSAGANPQTFAVGIVVAASATFVLPYGHPAMLLVRRPGGYRRSDYLRYGLGPCLLALGVIAFFVPFWWPW